MVDKLLPSYSVILVDRQYLPEEVAHLNCSSDPSIRYPAFFVDAAAIDLIQKGIFLSRFKGEVAEDHLEHYHTCRPYIRLSKINIYL